MSELQDESRRLKSTIRSKEEEIDKLQKESFVSNLYVKYQVCTCVCVHVCVYVCMCACIH